MADKVDPVIVPIEAKVDTAKLNSVRTQLAKPIQTAIQAAKSTVGGLASAANLTSEGAKSAVGGAASSGSSLLANVASGGIGGVLAGILGPVAGVTAAAGKFNPNTVQQFNYALDDLEATLGRFLLPMVEAWTDALRTAGDVLASILPDQNDLRVAFAEYKPLIEEVRSIMSDLAPLIKDVWVSSLREVAFELKIVVGAVKLFSDALRQLGVLGEMKDTLNRRAGAAGNFSFLGNQELHRQTLAGAFNRGSTSQDPAERTANYTEKIYEWLQTTVSGKAASAAAVGPGTGGVLVRESDREAIRGALRPAPQGPNVQANLDGRT